MPPLSSAVRGVTDTSRVRKMSGLQNGNGGEEFCYCVAVGSLFVDEAASGAERRRPAHHPQILATSQLLGGPTKISHRVRASAEPSQCRRISAADFDSEEKLG